MVVAAKKRARGVIFQAIIKRGLSFFGKRTSWQLAQRKGDY